MKTVNRILKIIKIPFKLMYQVGSIPVTFVYSKKKKLIKLIAPSNVKIVAVKIVRAGKKIIVTFAFIVSIINSSGVENQKMIESSCSFPAKMSIDRVIGLPNGGDGILPGADGFPLNSNHRRRHPFGRPRMRGKSITVDPPQDIQGFENIPKGSKVRSFREVDTGLNARRGNREDQCPASKFNMDAEHKNFVEEMKSKGHFVDDIDCDLERFQKLSTNSETDFIDRKSINEAKTILQSEQENLVTNSRRPNLNKGEPNFDFVVDGPGSYQYVDVKNPIDPRKFPPAKKKPESFNKMAKRIGEKITKQKGGSDKVLHIVDLEQIPFDVKEKFTQKIIEGAGSPNDIKFIN